LGSFVAAAFTVEESVEGVAAAFTGAAAFTEEASFTV
jgi:hypothetical protein